MARFTSKKRAKLGASQSPSAPTVAVIMPSAKSHNDRKDFGIKPTVRKAYQQIFRKSFT